MSAVVLDAPASYRLVERPAVPLGPGEVRIAVAAAGVCASDREAFHGLRPPAYVRYPVTPGHEWSGVVEEVGSGVPQDLIGRKTVGEGFRNCQVCGRCRAGDTTLCEAGYAETGFTEPGAFADTLVMPARLLHLLDDAADLRAAALLEPAACVAAGMLVAGARPGERVAVVGAGTLGLLAVQFLAASSPAELLVVDPRTERAELARRFGATETRVPDAGLAPEERYDLVVEAAGAPGSAVSAVRLARRGGRVVLVGMFAPGAQGIDPAEICVRQLTLHTVFGAPSVAWAYAVRAFTGGLIRPEPLITHELPLAEYATAVGLVGGGPTVGKVLLRP